MNLQLLSEILPQKKSGIQFLNRREKVGILSGRKIKTGRKRKRAKQVALFRSRPVLDFTALCNASVPSRSQ